MARCAERLKTLVAHPPKTHCPRRRRLAALKKRRAPTRRHVQITSAGGAPDQPPPGTDLPGGTVQLLLVEDNGPSRELLPLLLSEIAPQYAVDVAATAEDALTRAAAARYDGFIIDINLGAGMNGVKLMRELRDGPVYADTPMLACTAYALPGDEERFLREGFDAYLGKPYHADDLLEALETMFAT